MLIMDNKGIEEEEKAKEVKGQEEDENDEEMMIIEMMMITLLLLHFIIIIIMYHYNDGGGSSIIVTKRCPSYRAVALAHNEECVKLRLPLHLDVAPLRTRGQDRLLCYKPNELDVSSVTLILVVFSTIFFRVVAVQICSDMRGYHERTLCDDGGPNADYKGCRLGSDCVDCGVRESDIYGAKYHRLGRFDTLYKLQQKYGYRVPAIITME